MNKYVISDSLKIRKENWGSVLLNPESKSTKYYNESATSIIWSFKQPKSIDEVSQELNYSEEHSGFNLKSFLDDLITKNILKYTNSEKPTRAEFYFTNSSVTEDNIYFSPLGVEIEYTLKCSRNCSYCAYNSNPFIDIEGELTNQQWIKVLTDLKKAGVFFIRFTGGDPYARKGFNDLLKIADGFGFMISVGTDLTLLKDEDVQILSKMNNLIMVQTTLDGSTAEKNDSHRGKGNFEKVQKGLEILRDNKIPCIVGTVLRKNNADDIYNIGSILGKIGIGGYCFSPLYIAGRGHNVVELVPNNDDLYIASKQYRKLINEGIVHPADPAWKTITKDLSEEEFKHLLDDQPYLTRQGDRLIRVDSRGNCYVSIKLRDRFDSEDVLAGNVMEKGIIDIWQNSPVLNKLRHQKTKQTHFGMASDVRTINY